jgi:tRNA (cmo5U34)-methyltransferase
MTGKPQSPLFDRPGMADDYAQRPFRQVPGLTGLQRMVALLLAERVPSDGQVLVLGAGGGLDLRVFAEMQPDWRLTGIDPSPVMLDLARETMGSLAGQVTLIEGYIDDVPEGPFDGATCLLTLHFLDREQRRHTLAELARRLRPGAPLVVAHHSVPAEPEQRLQWLERSIAFGSAAAALRGSARESARMMAERLPLLSPAEDEALLREAGFAGVALFYAGFSFRGWVGWRA